MIFEPRQHQAEALSIASETLKNDSISRFQMIAPCGCGKTAIENWIIIDYGAQISMICVPSRALVVQFAYNWKKFSKDHDLILVFSSLDYNIKDDETLINETDIDEHISTDPTEIALALNNGERKKVIISTYNSAHKVGIALQMLDKRIGLCICDEAHTTASPMMNSYNRDILSNSLVNADKRIFFTATPRVYKIVKRKSNIYTDMNNKALYGPVVWDYPYERAIEEGIIVPIKLVVMGVKNKDIDDINIFKSDNKLNFISDTILKSFDDLNLNKIIVFKSYIKQHQQLTKIINQKQSDIVAKSIAGSDGMKKRVEALNQFGKGDVSILCNHYCLGEGVDIPSNDGVFLSEPVNSSIKLIQILGRSYRTFPGKKHGYVIIPLLINAGEEDKLKIVKSSTFKMLNEICESFMSQGIQTKQTWHHYYRGLKEKPDDNKTFIEFVNVDIDIQQFIISQTIDIMRDPWFEKSRFMHRLRKKV